MNKLVDKCLMAVSVVILVILLTLMMRNIFLKGKLDLSSVESPQIAFTMLGDINDGGGIDADTAVSTLRSACGNKHIKTLVLYMNSEGGSPNESERIGDAITRYCTSTKKVIVVVDGTCLSACYLIAIHANEIYLNRYGKIGAVGTIWTWTDYTKGAENQGIVVRQIVSGPKKGGIFGETFLTKAQIDDAQDFVDASGTAFVGDVFQFRHGKIKPDADIYNGGIYSHAQALELGLIDGTKTIDEIQDDYPNLLFLTDTSYMGESAKERVSRSEQVKENVFKKLRSYFEPIDG